MYTRTGDDGTTALGDFSRTSKNDPRLHAYAGVGEANAAIGVAVACGDLESDCDHYLPRTEKMRSFILPGGTPGSAHLHPACTIVRRAERSAWAAVDAHGHAPGSERGAGGVSVLTAKYLNRLSDLLFILARVANLPLGGDIPWQPGGGRVAQPIKRR